jgi:hypothetical protein
MEIATIESHRNDLEFKPSYVDNDIWLRPATKLNGDTYYEMLLVHTDDLLCISEDPKSILTKLDQHYLLKKDSTLAYQRRI